MNSKKIYLSGKITGDGGYKEKFEKKARELSDAGYQVFNPASYPDIFTHEQFMELDLKALSFCDAVYMMDGWQESKGAVMEHEEAKKLGKQLLYENSRERPVEEKTGKTEAAMELEFGNEKPGAGEVPFEIVDNREKGRVNIRFNPAKENPYFFDIIEELKSGNWRYAPSARQWYPVRPEGSRVFAENLQKKYRKMPAAAVIDAANEEFVSTGVVKIDTSVQKDNLYAGIRFFDRNYREPEEFAAYFNRNISVLGSGLAPISREKAGVILQALNHQDGSPVQTRTDRLGLGADNSLVIMTKRENETEYRKTDLKGLLRTANEMAETALSAAEKAAADNRHNDCDDALKNVCGSLLASCTENTAEVKEKMNALFSEYVVRPEQTAAGDLFREEQQTKKETLLKKGEPYVEISFCESSDGKTVPKGTVWTLKEADRQIPELNEKFKGSWLKTDADICMPETDGTKTSYHFTFDLGTDSPAESLSDYVRMMCSYPGVLDAFEKTWCRVYTPAVTEEQKQNVQNILAPHKDRLEKNYRDLKKELEPVLKAGAALSSRTVIDFSDYEASEMQTAGVCRKIGKTFENALRECVRDTHGYETENKSGELSLYIGHAIKNLLQDCKYEESRSASATGGFDFALWRKSLEQTPRASDFDSLILEEKNALQQGQGQTDIAPLEADETIGNSRVADVYTISSGVWQATLTDTAEKGSGTSGSFFVIDSRVAEKCNPGLLDLMEKHGSRYVIETKRNEPYILKELIDKGLMPPRDGEFTQKLSEYIEKYPVKYAKLYPVTANNFPQKLKELARIDSSRQKSALDLGRQLIAMTEAEPKKELGEWLVRQGCTSEEKMQGIFDRWITGREQKPEPGADKKQKKDGGYPPRGGN